MCAASQTGMDSSTATCSTLSSDTLVVPHVPCCCGYSHFHPPPMYLPPGTPSFLRAALGDRTDREYLLQSEAEKCAYVCWKYEHNQATWTVDTWTTLHKLCKQISVIGLSCHPPRPYPVQFHHTLVVNTARALLEWCSPATGDELGSPITSVVREFTYVLQYVRQWQVRVGLKPGSEVMSEAVVDSLTLTTTLLRLFLHYGYSANEHTFHRHLRCDTPLDRIIFMIWNIHIHDCDFTQSLCSYLCHHLQEVVLALIQYGGVLHRWRHVAELFLFRPSQHQYYMDMFLNSSSHYLYMSRLKSVSTSSQSSNDYSYPGNAHEVACDRKYAVREYVSVRMSGPRSLKQLSRLRISQACEGKLGLVTECLPLPTRLKHYLLLQLD